MYSKEKADALPDFTKEKLCNVHWLLRYLSKAFKTLHSMNLPRVTFKTWHSMNLPGSFD